MRGVSVGRGFANDLVEGRDSFEDFEPAIHAESEHALFDGSLLNFCRARALHDQLPEPWRHVQDFVKSLTSAQTRTLALLASLSAEDGDVLHLAVERDLIHERLGGLAGSRLRVV